MPIPKKGDLTLPLNYRGISLIPIAAKIYNKLLLNRLVPALDPLLRNNQNGFRGGRSTISQILALRRIIEEMKRLDKDFTICFVYFRKAFDSINREVMFNILPLYGIPQPIIAAIKALYTHTQASVITPDGETDFFDIEAGVLQGVTRWPHFCSSSFWTMFCASRWTQSVTKACKSTHDAAEDNLPHTSLI